MSYIPDIRDPFEPDFTGQKTDAEKEENAYYQGYLNEKDAEYIAGYDYAVEVMFESFFYNLDIYTDEHEDCGFDDQRLASFNRHFSDFIQKENTSEPLDLETIEDSHIRLLLSMYRSFHHYAEMERDEIGTGLIEGMEEADYDDCREKCKQGYKNILLRIQEAKEKGEL